MAIGIILGIVFFALTAVAFSYGAYQKTSNDNKVACGILCGLGVILLVAFILVPFSFHTVDTGEISVVKHLGEAREVRTAGTHYDFWITNTYQTYDSKVQNDDIKTMAYSSDAQTMDIQMTIQYHILGDKVLDIARQYGSLDILQNRIESVAIEKTKSVLSAYKAMDIIANRAKMSPMVEESIKNAIGNEYFVSVTTVVLTNIDFTDAFEKAVEDKMVAEQTKLKADYENETKVAKAKADAEALVVKTEAEAKAKLIAADAEAEANRKIDSSLTERILREKYLDKWNGVLPSVVAGEETNLLIPSVN